MSGLHLRLKEATRTLHEDLEAAAPMQPLLGEEPTVEAYAAMLARSLSLHRPLEARLRAHPLPPQRKLKTPLLEADLRALGHDPLAVEDRPADELPEVANEGHAAGVWYVLEGSTMGNQLIMRHLEQRLEDGLPTSAFLAAYGADVGAVWRVFRDWLDTLDGSVHDDAIAAAQHTFGAFKAAML